jgi:gliding motility-associated-like protein
LWYLSDPILPTVRPVPTIACCLLALHLAASGPPVARFTENKGQWPAQVAYRALVPGGALFVERNALTYVLHSGGAMEQHAHDAEGPLKPAHAHAFRVYFEGAQSGIPEGHEALPYYENFFLGNDPGKWGTRCGVFGGLGLKGLYPGVDLRMDGGSGIKYDFIVAAGADPATIRLHFEGQENLTLKDGRLFVGTTAGTVIEEAPVAWQELPTGRKGVPCRYVLQGGTITFEFPEGHDPAFPLVIDPVLTFSSFSGSTADNFGFTATYDNTGHLFGGGIVFGVGYPSTTGVLDPVFNGGTIDIGISKFSPDGSSLVWSTYIGGSGNETPHSLVVNTNDELYLLGSTGSLDFPTSSGAYDNTFNGGNPIGSGGGAFWTGMTFGYGYGHDSGTDILVAHFSADATSLIASTYVGGSGNDGVNNVLPLTHNYGDHFRGEIALSPSENPVVATSTQSADIPVSATAPQATFGGGTQDAYIFTMDPTLSTLTATFYGGSGEDSGYGVQFDSNGQVFVAGGTTSTNLPMSGQPLQNSNGGGLDGFALRLSPTLGQFLSSTYLGTPAYDQGYFVQLDLDDDVYVVGQTHGAYPISSGVYSNPGSSQFIQKMDHGLTTSLWSTRIGSGTGSEDISPSAFLVSDCGQIYFSGWGGIVNHYVQAATSTTNGLPVTADAYQSTTDGSDFYLMVLAEDAAALNYGTYFGGPSSHEHVDGGTSRFDKHGTVYQAVCAGCGGQSDFPTTPGAWSTVNASFNCNLGVFKFDLLQPTAHIEVDGPDFACLPGPTVSFINLSVGGTIYDWDFGDGTDTTAFEPTHVYTSAGTYTVRLVLSDDDVCTSDDTAYVDVHILQPLPATIDPVPPLCPGDSVQLHAHGGHLFQWLPAPGITNLAVADPVVSPPATATYSVLVTDSCGTDTATITVTVAPPTGISAGNDTTVCLGSSVQLTATGGGTYSWTPSATIDNATSATPLATPLDTTLYHVQVTTPQGCLGADSVLVMVISGLPDPQVTDTVICRGGTAQLHAQGGITYAWQALPGITDIHVPDPQVAPDVPTAYVVSVSNACGTVLDTAFVDVRWVVADAWPDTLVCPNESLVLHASGGTIFQWAPIAASTDSLVLSPAVAGIYSVAVLDSIGCTGNAQVTVSLYPAATVSAGYESTVDYGYGTVLHAFGTGTFLWSPDSTLSCSACPDPLAAPASTTVYTVEVTDTNGCKATDQVIVYFRGSIFVPNTFTPNNDGVNDSFFALAHEVTEFRMLVFNRWGMEIFETDRLDGAWDGTYNGVESPIDTYVWRVDYTTTNGSAHTTFGHVNLIR